MSRHHHDFNCLREEGNKVVCKLSGKAARKPSGKGHKEARAFQEMMTVWMVAHGAVISNHSTPELNRWDLQTKVGRAQISIPGPIEGFPDLSRNPTIFVRFDDIPLASSVLGTFAINQHSGKWNHHFPDGTTAPQALQTWQRVSAKIVIPT